jgi:hypothetical protein
MHLHDEYVFVLYFLCLPRAHPQLLRFPSISRLCESLKIFPQKHLTKREPLPVDPKTVMPEKI